MGKYNLKIIIFIFIIAISGIDIMADCEDIITVYEPNVPGVWHVAKSGDDSNTGKSFEQAFKTIQFAVDIADSNDTILVWPGVYEQYTVIDDHSKSLTLKAADYPPVLKAIIGDPAMRIDSGTNLITIQNFIITNGTTLGGIEIWDSFVVVKNCTFVNNTTGLYLIIGTFVEISDSIFTDNIVSIVNNTPEFPYTIHHSYREDVDGLPKPAYADPNVTDPNNLNVQLKSMYGRYDRDLCEWVFDPNTSIGIDWGDPNDIPIRETQPNGGRINIGAFGGTPYAGKSSSWPSDSDFNYDRIVNLYDLNIFANQWELVPGVTNLAALGGIAEDWLQEY